MAKKGHVFEQYSEEFKFAAVRQYLEGAASYKVVAEQLEIRSCTQLKVWVRNYREGEAFDTGKGSSSPLKGRPRATFGSIEEKRNEIK